MNTKRAPGFFCGNRKLTVAVVILASIFPSAAYCEQQVSKSYSLGGLLFAFAMVVLLGWVFYLVFRWSQRNEQASYLGGVYRDTVFEFEFSRRKVQVDKKRGDREYEREAFRQDVWLIENRNKERPQLPEHLRKYIKRRQNSGTGGLGGSTPLPGMPQEDKAGYTSIQDGYSQDPWASPETHYIDEKDMKDQERADLEQYRIQQRNFEKSQHEWRKRLQDKEEDCYQKGLDVARKEAESAAARAIGDVDITIFRGRGPTFVLEFTAIVVIIFSAVILGILDILNGNQIGTLLAAVAGYVLGRSTTRAQENEPAKPQEGESGSQQASEKTKEANSG